MSALPLLIGHDRALAPLRRAAREGRQHHALLLQGPEGIGKRLAALHLALFGVCDAEDPAARPCGVCKACRDAMHPEHLHPDVGFVEPDPTKKTALLDVGRIRQVVSGAGLARWRGRFRTWIIDPADAMNAAAQNALLKTLEEPNPGTGFILVTARPKALLPTIRSRCLQVRLTPVPTPAIAQWLQARGVAPDDAQEAARRAGGRPGHALTLSEPEAMAHRTEARDALLRALGGTAGEMFQWGESVGKAGRTAAREALDLVDELLRDVVLQGAGGDHAARALHPDLADGFDRWVTVLWPDGVARLTDTVADARRSLDLNVSARAVMDALVLQVAAELGPARTALARRPIP